MWVLVASGTAEWDLAYRKNETRGGTQTEEIALEELGVESMNQVFQNLRRLARVGTQDSGWGVGAFWEQWGAIPED